MSQLFFKSNAEGAEMVGTQANEAEENERAREAMIAAVQGAAEAVLLFGEAMQHATRTMSLCAFHFGIVRNITLRMDRLRRQHKAKGRGKNWRTVR